MGMDPKTIEAIYRMTHEQKLSHREISRQLHVARKTIRKYLQNPDPKPIIRKPRPSKLDPFKPVIRELLDQCPRASSAVLAQRIRPLGYDGGGPSWKHMWRVCDGFSNRRARLCASNPVLGIVFR
jgi:transposase